MKTLKAFSRRLRGLLHAHRAENDFAAELDSHVAMHVEDGMSAGLSAEEARRQALIKLGGLEQTRQAYRERVTLVWFENLVRDVRYALRMLVRQRAVTAVAVVSIGLGIGANATIFSMVSRFVLRPAPVGDPSTLLSLQIIPDKESCCNKFSWPLYQDMRDDARSFSSVAAYYDLLPASIGGSGEPERVWGQATTTNFFDTLELPMVLGRSFTNDEDSKQVIVLGEALWRRRFGGDPTIVGSTILLSGRTFTVIGIAPAAFHSIEQILNAQFWVPLGTAAQLVPNLPQKSARDYHWLAIAARMRPEVTRVQVRAELNTLAARFAQSFPATDKGEQFVMEQAGGLQMRDRTSALIFLGALLLVVLLLLAIAAANVANLLFAQAANRQRDMAVRLALGATRARLQRQMLIESTLMATCGGVLGVLLSLWSTRGLSAVKLPAPVPLDLHIGIDWRVLLFCFVLSVLSGVLLGIGPAWAAARPLVASALKGEEALARPGRKLTLRNLLMIAQMAMSVVLLSATVLFLRSLQGAASINIGFNPHGTLIFSVDPRLHGYTAERTVNFLNQLRDRVAALPGVANVVCTDVAPLSGGNRSDGFTAPGESGKKKPFTYADLYMVTPGYFKTLGISLLAGHDFGNDAAGGPRMAVINKTFADRLFHGLNPVGRQVNGPKGPYEIIGVVADVKSRTLGEQTRPILYRSLAQSVESDPSFMGYTLIVKTAGDPAVLSEAVRRQVYALDPAMAIYNEETMEEHVRTAYVLPNLGAALFGIFGSIGVTLATTGLYGVIDYSVSRRTREIGIRIALGARPGTVERLFLRQGLVLTLIALALGWPAAWMLTKIAASLLYGVQPHDAVTFFTVPLLLVAVALGACWIPARRAALVDPIQTLRTE
ncbi:MAG TPA: ABC transporter permease [Terracidiphilus sp.]|nr:ABC transporter permease [Terracidiphilus sp.]